MKAEQILGYRKPWVLVDNIVEVHGSERIVTQKLITTSDYFLQGHFPHYSIYPGMLVMEGMKQSAELLLILSGSLCSRRGVGRLRQLAARFAQPLEPGDTVTYIVTRMGGQTSGQFVCRAVVEDVEVARARLTLEEGECRCQGKC